jgi:hypothetical protein
MTRTKEMETDRFTSQSDTGRKVVIVEITTFLEAVNFEETSWVEGQKSYRTREGDRVNCKGQGEYEVVNTGEKLWRV